MEINIERPKVCELEVFNCPDCNQKLLLAGDKHILKFQRIIMFCPKCQKNYLFEIKRRVI